MSPDADPKRGTGGNVEASGGGISAKRNARFRSDPRARLFDAAGEVALVPQAGAAVLDDRPGGLALLAALGRGAGFRIGLAGPAPEGEGMFETLTSGSSGQPRRIRRSVASWQASFAVNAGLFGIGPGVAVAVLGRLSHSLSLYGALEGVAQGASVHLLDGLRPDRQRAALAARGVAVIHATPAQLRLLAEAGGKMLPDLRLVLVGGSKLDPGLRAAMAQMAPAAALREFYGAAEASFITLSDAATPEDSVGAPYPGVELQLRGGMPAEIWVRSPYLFQGYGGDDPGGARWDAGWLSVGEMSWLRDGQLYLAGRAGRMVTVADQNVFPEEVEALLQGLPGVARVAVLSRPDGLRGQVLVAVCQGDPVQEDAILRAARQALGPLKAPRALIWRQDWPVLASGKSDLARIDREAGPWR